MFSKIIAHFLLRGGGGGAGMGEVHVYQNHTETKVAKQLIVPCVIKNSGLLALFFDWIIAIKNF